MDFFIFIVISGGLSISASTTFLAAIAAKAGGKGSLFTVISFPIILPIIWVAINATTGCLDKADYFNYDNLIFLIAFAIVITGLSYLLFRHLWEEE